MATLARAEKVLLVGDSITAGCCASKGYAEIASEILANVGAPGTLIGGCYGSTTEDWIGLDDRVSSTCSDGTLEESLFATWILPEPKPVIVTILLGTNDARQFPRALGIQEGPFISLADYEANLRELIALIKERQTFGYRIILMTPPRIFNAVPAVQGRIDDYRLAVFRICADIPTVSCGPDLYELLGPEDFSDSVHPNDAGHLKIGMALGHQILSELHFITVPSMPSQPLLVIVLAAVGLKSLRSLQRRAADAQWARRASARVRGGVSVERIR